MAKKLAIIFLWSMLAACGASEQPSPVYKGQMSATERGQAEYDYRSFTNHCSILYTRYVEDIGAVEIYAQSMYYPDNTLATEIRIMLKNETQHIPNAYRAWGHTLFYYVRSDGISTRKDQSYQVCNWPSIAPSGNDAFYSFAILETL